MQIGAARLWRAPAKVNLTLNVLGRRLDGYHEIESLVAFSGVCDWLAFAPAESLSLVVEGPTAEDAGADEANLVLKAARALIERAPRLKVGGFRLIKRLPVAAGLGGGSSDAAAALRALAELNGLSLDDPLISEAARATGADVAVCLDPRARKMRGVGDLVGPALGLSPLPSVLVNPRVAVPTPEVFAALGLARGAGASFGDVPRIDVGEALIPSLRAARNDLQRAASSIAPAIDGALARLSACEGALVARMSGSGATTFAIFADRASAARAARALGRERPDWWVRATYLR